MISKPLPLLISAHPWAALKLQIYQDEFGTEWVPGCWLDMSHHHQHEAQRRILRHIGSLIKLQAVGITMDPLPETIALQLQHLKRCEDERDIDK